MNKRITLLLVGFVVMILPTIAVADMMVSGTADMTGSSHSTVFTVNQGSNYQQADGYVVWKPLSGPNYMGDLRFNNAPNEVILALNVIEINFDSGLAAGTFYLNITGKTTNLFPAGSMLYLSTTPTSFADFYGNSYTPSSPAPGIIAMSLVVPHNTMIHSGPISVGGGINTIYVGAYLVAGEVPNYPTVPELAVTGTYISSP